MLSSKYHHLLQGLGMSNWDDWNYFGESVSDEPKRIYLKFCLTCARNESIKGPRYKIFRTSEIGLLVDAGTGYECKVCRHPIFTTCHYQIYTKRVYIPKTISCIGLGQISAEEHSREILPNNYQEQDSGTQGIVPEGID